MLALKLSNSGVDLGPPEPEPTVEDWPDIPCHCRECLPCSHPCCDNPVVRAGRCCDPSNLGHCLQPYEVGQFYSVKEPVVYRSCSYYRVSPKRGEVWKLCPKSRNVVLAEIR